MCPFDPTNGAFVALPSEQEQQQWQQLHQNAETSRKLGVFVEPNASNPAERAKNAVTAVYLTSQGLSRELPIAARYEDSNLSPEGLTAERERQVQQLRDAVAQRNNVLRANLAEAQRAASATAEPHKPKLDPNDAAQLIRTEQAWNNTIKPQLDKGKGWDEIMATLDADGILAAQRFAPGHEAAKRSRFDQHEVPATLNGIQRMSERRLVEVTPEGPAREALQQEAQVNRYAEVAQANMAALEGVTGARDVVHASIPIKSSTYAVGAQPAPSQPAQA